MDAAGIEPAAPMGPYRVQRRYAALASAICISISGS